MAPRSGSSCCRGAEATSNDPPRSHYVRTPSPMSSLQRTTRRVFRSPIYWPYEPNHPFPRKQKHDQRRDRCPARPATATRGPSRSPVLSRHRLPLRAPRARIGSPDARSSARARVMRPCSWAVAGFVRSAATVDVPGPTLQRSMLAWSGWTAPSSLAA